MSETHIREGDKLRFDKNGELWFISKQFLSGAFGEVFRLNNKNNEVRAMKLEPRKNTEGAHLCRLKVEVRVLRQMDKHEGFPKLYYAGRTTNRNFMVMENLGPDLNRIRRSLPGKRFTVSTALRISAQILQRLEALHLAGWIYRDVKPQNFAIGTGENSSVIYILDFGMTRNVRSKARHAAPAAGTFRYTSLRTNYHHEQSYRDDLESWAYMTIDFVAGKLPWSHAKYAEDRLIIIDMKNYCRHRAGRRELFAVFPPQFEEIFNIILALKYQEFPDYELIKKHFSVVVNLMKVDPRNPLDWEEDNSVLKCASKIGDLGESDYLPALFNEMTQYNNDCDNSGNIIDLASTIYT